MNCFYILLWVGMSIDFEFFFVMFVEDVVLEVIGNGVGDGEKEVV